MPRWMASSFFAPTPGRPASLPAGMAASSSATLVMPTERHRLWTSFGPTPFTRVISIRLGGTSLARSSSWGKRPVVAMTVSFSAISLPTPLMSVSGSPAATMAATASPRDAMASAALR